MMELVAIATPRSRSPMVDGGRSAAFLSWLSCLSGACGLLVFAAAPARAALFSLASSGTISGSTDEAIPVGTPWAFEIVYDTDAPDLDAEATDFGSFGNTSDPPAMVSFHYQAGDYEVTLDDPADFDIGSDIVITFTSVYAIDINVDAPVLFPPLGGEAVSFHADFNDFSSRPIFVSDSLPTDPAIGPESFDQSTVSLLPAGGGVVSGGSIETFTISPVPEPSTGALEATCVVVLVASEVNRRRNPSRAAERGALGGPEPGPVYRGGCIPRLRT